MVNYQLGKIYKIIHLDTNECYIGSTCEPTFAQRLAKHVANHKAYTKGTGGYCTSYIIITITTLFSLKITHATTEMNSTREKVISRRPWLLLTRSKIRELLMKLANKNIRKNTVKKNKDCLKEYDKQYHLHNKEKKKEYNKLYHEAKKDSLKQQQNAKYLCCCGDTYMHCNKSKHLNTHKINLELLT